MKLNKQQKIHITIIILGIIFILISAFHQDIWFDESYSVAIAKHNIFDIWNITGNDVHPALYYWMLHFVYLIFGNNVIAFRLFSVLAIAILGILGYTHIRKDFGEKTGILFSFLTYFLPIMCTYSQEIRMYSWSCLIVSLMSIYAYRFYRSIKNDDDKKIKNLIIFGIFSIASCYIHYYALVTACLVNLLLLIYVIRNAKKDKKTLKNFLILAVVQIVLYIPWLLYFVGQLEHVGGGFWIVVGPINTTVEVLSFQFRRQLDTDFEFNIQTIVALISAILMYAYIGYRVYKAKKEKEDIKPALLSGFVYVGVIAIMLIASIVTPILFSRYLMVMTGLYIFTLAFMMSKEKKKWITILVCTIILILGIISNVTNIMINYDSSNMKQIEYIKENIQEDDIIIYSNIGNGGVIAAFFPDNKQYFYNGQHWDVEEAYKAYGPGMETIYDYNDVLENYHGRIWLIDSEYMGLWNDEFPKEGITILKDAQRFDTKYQNYIYNIMLLEKE
jgi:uncharacterized membrane protein